MLLQCHAPSTHQLYRQVLKVALGLLTTFPPGPEIRWTVHWEQSRENIPKEKMNALSNEARFRGCGRSSDGNQIRRYRALSGFRSTAGKATDGSKSFFRTLKEQLLWVERFRNIEELRVALIAFQVRYNNHWIVQRLAYRTPAQARRDALIDLQVAA